jgi:cysteine desulfuration protein SufE
MEIQEIIENFEFLDDWEDRYKYLIELGNDLEPFPKAQQSATNKVQGCVSQVWITAEPEARSADPKIHFIGTSDAHIVRGLIAVTMAIFSDRKASEILETDEQAYFGKLQLSEHITPQRSNGLRAMVGRIKEIAKQNLQAA